MTAQEYIQSKLDELKQPLDIDMPKNQEELASFIKKTLLSKKFRKYAANDELISHVEEAIRVNLANNQPINITFLHGAYKLWRLNEAPEADWAELFALTYYSNWVKAICEVYEPGVWFDFFVDDLIIPELNNISAEDVDRYIDSYQKVIDFLKSYQPQNLTMTITRVGSKFDSPEAFDESLMKNRDKLAAELLNGLPVLDDAQKAMVELNAKPTDEQLADPMWREKIFLLHDAYMETKGEPGYHKNRPEKILAFNQPLPSGTVIAVGTTKSSIMKFWIGVGALKKDGDAFTQAILSPNQLEKTDFEWQPVDFGISGKNFGKIRIVK